MKKNWGKKNNTELHISVLLDELVNSIRIFKKKNIIVDCTLGMWWHAREIIKKLNKWDTFIWFDADKRNLEIAQPKLQEEFKDSWIELIFINDNFSNLKKRIEELWFSKITGIYYDLWISSLHVDDGERGFSFRIDGPLDMRFNPEVWISASQIVNSYSKDELLRIFREYGEEPAARKIAEWIFAQRKLWTRFHTTKQLSDYIGTLSKFPKSKTRIFQALRIEANGELDVIEKSLQDAIELLDIWGTIFVISFHSLEDRIVKNIFKKESKDCICSDIICMCHHKKSLEILSKKPILPTDAEIQHNSRSRSAKARYAKKI